MSAQHSLPMRGVVAIAARGPWARGGLPPTVERRVPTLLPRALPPTDVPLHVATHVGVGRQVLLVAWAQGPPQAPADLLTHGPRGCVAYTGYFTEADTISDVVQGARLTEVTHRAGGCYSIYREQDGILEAATIVSRLDSVYMSETARLAVFSSRALLAHLVAQSVLYDSDTPSIRLDHLGVREVAQNGFCVTDVTTFEGVRAVPAAAVVTVSRMRVKVSIDEVARVPAAAVRPATSEWNARMDVLADAAQRAVEPARYAPRSAYLGLSGGRDSRVVIAALSAAGIKVRTGTSGYLTHPDLQIATKLAAVLGIDHNVRVPSGARAADDANLVVPHPVEVARHAVWATEGMVSAFDTPRVANAYNVEAINLSGSGGEVTRGGYLVAEDSPSRDSRESR